MAAIFTLSHKLSSKIYVSYNLTFKIGMDLIGPMKASTAGMVYIMTVTDYCSRIMWGMKSCAD